MAIPTSPPVYNSHSTTSGGGVPPTAAPQRLALDNLIRRELRVGDPSDPQQIAQALLTRYQRLPRAAAIAQEAHGLPFLQTIPAEPRGIQAPTSSEAELQQAVDDVERDLQELTTNSLLKDITPELAGWATAIRSAMAEGTTAARFALDPRQRDKAFSIRRQLGDYARMARLVGALTPTLSPIYRKAAQSLDEVAAVLLVLMGEALANIGFSSGQFLLQVPYTELQVRRDAVIYALRNLIGAAQEAYGPNDWPRGLHAYRDLFRELETQGQGDLRALLLETELMRAMDELIQRADHGRVEGLRALGATARLDLERFRRLVIIGQQVIPSPSPPLTAFLEALQLFVEAFNSSGGFRLLRIARPPILFYGLYGITSLAQAEQRLLAIILQRNLLADRLDCFLQCGCTQEAVICQVLLDKILYDMDRAIDLYALGTHEFGDGPPERRARAYGHVIESFLSLPGQPIPVSPGRNLNLNCLNVNTNLNPPLQPILETLRNSLFMATEDVVRQQELCMQMVMQQRWQNLVTTMAPACTELNLVFRATEEVIQRAIRAVGGNPATCLNEFNIHLPDHYEVSLENI